MLPRFPESYERTVITPTNAISPTRQTLDLDQGSTMDFGLTSPTESFVRIAMTQMIRVAPPIDRKIWSKMRNSYDQIKLVIESRFPEAMSSFESSLEEMRLEAEEINIAANSLTSWIQSPRDALCTMMRQLQDPWRKRLDRMFETYRAPPRKRASTTDARDSDNSLSNSEDINPSMVADDSTLTGGNVRKRSKKKARNRIRLLLGLR